MGLVIGINIAVGSGRKSSDSPTPPGPSMTVVDFSDTVISFNDVVIGYNND